MNILIIKQRHTGMDTGEQIALQILPGKHHQSKALSNSRAISFTYFPRLKANLQQINQPLAHR